MVDIYTERFTFKTKSVIMVVVKGGGFMSLKAGKFFYPFIFSVSVLVVFLLFLLSFSKGDMGLGGAAIGLIALVAIVCVALPIYCFMYGKKVLLKEKTRFVFTLYNSAIITLFYFLPLCMEDETYIYSLVLFAWCELWSSLPLLIYKNRPKKSNENTQKGEVR